MMMIDRYDSSFIKLELLRSVLGEAVGGLLGIIAVVETVPDHVPSYLVVLRGQPRLEGGQHCRTGVVRGLPRISRAHQSQYQLVARHSAEVSQRGAAPLTHPLQISPVQVDVLEVLEGSSGVLVPFVIGLDLVEVDRVAGILDDVDEVVPVGVAGGVQDSLIDRGALGSHSQDLVAGNGLEGSLELDYQLGDHLRVSVVALDANVHPVEVVPDDQVDQGTHELVAVGRRREDVEPVCVTNRDQHFLPGGLPLVERRLGEVRLVHLGTTVLPLHQRVGQHHHCCPRAHVVALRIATVPRTKTTVILRQPLL